VYIHTRPSGCHEFHQAQNVVIGIDSVERFVEKSLEHLALKVAKQGGQLETFLAI
jgi:hypothetical protein